MLFLFPVSFSRNTFHSRSTSYFVLNSFMISCFPSPTKYQLEVIESRIIDLRSIMNCFVELSWNDYCWCILSYQMRRIWMIKSKIYFLFFCYLFFSLILSLLGFMMRFFPKHRRLKTASKTFFLFYELVNHTSLLLRQPSALSSKRNKPMVNWKQFSSFQRTPPSSGDGRYL